MPWWDKSRGWPEAVQEMPKLSKKKVKRLSIWDRASARNAITASGMRNRCKKYPYSLRKKSRGWPLETEMLQEMPKPTNKNSRGWPLKTEQVQEMKRLPQRWESVTDPVQEMTILPKKIVNTASEIRVRNRASSINTNTSLGISQEAGH